MPATQSACEKKPPSNTAATARVASLKRGEILTQVDIFDNPASSVDAYGFAERYVRRCPDPFSPEELISAAAKAGIFFQDQRGWGKVFHTLHKDGLIKPAGLFSRKTSNGSVRPGWVRV